MASSTVNVVRYTALLSGVAFGWYHRRSLQAAHDTHKLKDATHQREKLITEAKQAWKRKQEASSDTTLITDPEDPHFDLERLIAQWEKSS